MPPCVRSIAAATAFALATLGAAAAPFERGLLFRLDRAGVPPSYVFGTIHSADPRVTALPAPVVGALRGVRTFAREIELSERDLADFFDAAQFDDGRRLTDYVDAATYAAIRVALGAAAPPEATLRRMKPWAVLLKLAEFPDSANPGGDTLDRVLLAEAHRRRLEIVGLELADEQVSAFDAIPLASQVALVHFVLTERGSLARDHDAAVAAWLDRDLGRLAALNAEPGRRTPAVAPHFAALTRHLIEDRSVVMAHRLTLPLRRGRVFVAIGAMHLYGERGLLALLREQGYRVRRVWRVRCGRGGRRMARRWTGRYASECRSAPSPPVRHR
jgi:uncharacterized protein